MKAKTKAQVTVAYTMVTAGNTALSGAPLRFDISDAAGVALKSTTRTRAAESGIVAVAPNGDIREAVSSGNALISSYVISPDGQMYVVFSSKVTLDGKSTLDGGVPCLLAVIDKGTGVPSCVDSSLAFITTPIAGISANRAMQFDSNGALYYLGMNDTNTTVLRKYDHGTTTDLITDNVSIYNFHVMSNGTVVLSGMSNATNVKWIRRINVAGALKSVVSNSAAAFMKEFPDGNVYFGSDETGGWRVRRYLAASDTSDPTPWIWSGISGAVHQDDEPLCGVGNPNGALCGAHGALTKGVFQTASGKVYAIAAATGGKLFRYYPTLAATSSVLTGASVGQVVENKIFLAGTNAAGENMLTIYDTATDTEQVILDSTNEVEIYHLTYVASTNKVMFDGLRFADNKYVLGQIDATTLQESSVTTTGAKWSDFQTFG